MLKHPDGEEEKQEDMIDRYLDKGTMYVSEDGLWKSADHPIFECGKQLVDMIYLRKSL